MNRSFAILIFIVAVFGHFSFGQRVERIDLTSNRETGFRVVKKKVDGIQAVNKVGAIRLVDKSTPEGLFKAIESEGFVKSFRKGHPDLPFKTRLLQIPAGASVELKIEGYDEEIVQLKERGIHQKIMPAQPSRPKKREGKEKFYYDEQVYKTNRFLGKELVKFEEIGTMRNIRLGRLEISPFQYNPVKNQLKVIRDLQFTISFTGGKTNKDGLEVKGTSNPYYKLVENNTINNTQTKEVSNASIGDAPFTYVIVSPPEFEDHLQPFIEWKEKKGFHVVEGYTDSIGSSKVAIKDFLQQLYEEPAQSPPSFVLLVGGIAQIPSWPSRVGGSHVTDLYYCEYTGDHLPEVFYGRFPAKDTSQLKTMVNKTLEYEKYGMSDPSYLNKTLLVAGNDEEYEDPYGNGQMNYGTDYYFNADNGIVARAFLQDPPEGNEAVSDSIINNVNRGTGFVNYSGHGISKGWSDPSFNLEDISSLTDNGKYGLWISNSCWTLKFDEPECFGGAALRAENKGAVGAIGASGETFWDEDYWWSVGLTSNIVAHPTYKESGLGMYDRMFHTHGEDPSEWYITQGQMIAAGNLAVESSASYYNDFYWEVYHLMGDPSLMPYFRIPDTLSVSHFPDEFILGMDALTASTDPFTYVAISYNGKLLDAGLADETGTVTLSFPKLQRPGEIELLATAQNKQPYKKSIDVKIPDQPYLILESTTFRDSAGKVDEKVDYGETVGLDVVLENVSDSFAAYNVTDSLYTSDPYIELTEYYKQCGHVPPDTLSEKIKGFEFTVSDSVEDQHKALINMDIRGEDEQGTQYVWHSKFRFTIDAPSLKIGDLILDDGPGGNDSLDPGETVDLHAVIHNEGHASVKNVKGTLNIRNDRDYLFVNESEDEMELIEAGAADTLTFRITADPDAPEGVPLYWRINVSGGTESQYRASDRRRIILGTSPAYRISEGDTIHTNYGLFFDSGGSNENYGNGEYSKITFKPADRRYKLTADFKSFDVEAHFDSLRVFDGTSVEAPLIGKYDNDNKPDLITAKNDSGALTFDFQSDRSVTGAGWDAEIMCLPRDTVIFRIGNGKSGIKGAKIGIDGNTYETDSGGEVSFVLKEGTYEYAINKEGYQDVTGVLELEGNIEKEFVLRKTVYDVSFALYGADGEILSEEGEVILDDSSESTEQSYCTFKDIWSVGKHSYQVNVPEYHIDSGSFYLNSDTTINIVLEKIKYPVNLTVLDEEDQPLDSVSVKLDTLNRFTDKTGKVDFLLEKGIYPLHLYKDYYTEYNDDLQIDDTTSMTIKLSRFYTLAFKVVCKKDSEAVSGAQIHIDTMDLRTDSIGEATTELTRGVYEYTVEASGYEQYQSTVRMSQDSSIQVGLFEINSGQQKLVNEDILIYPNPANGIVNIKNKTNYEFLNLQIYNLTGKMIYSKIIEEDLVTIDFRGYPEGMYLVRLSKDGKQITKKLLID